MASNMKRFPWQPVVQLSLLAQKGWQNAGLLFTIVNQAVIGSTDILKLLQGTFQKCQEPKIPSQKCFPNPIISV